MFIARLFVSASAVYWLLGLLFAVWFVASAVDRFDPAARGAGVAFRLAILPGVAAFWPVLLLRWIRER